jgi:hypothetical protein
VKAGDLGERGARLILSAMRTVPFAFGLVAAILVSATALAGDSKTIHPVVVELFTSQGCNDCPPADRLLADIAQRRDVIAITYPITYWDMLGWKDTLATEANTERQRAYARAMNHSGIYTPQMIVDGTEDVIGSRRDKVLAAIARRAAAPEKPYSIPIAIAASEDRIEIAIAGSPRRDRVDARVWVLQIRARARVDVEEGENAGKTLFYANVVRRIKEVGFWNGGPLTIDLPYGVRDDGRDGVVVLLQSKGHGAIIGAAMVLSRDRVPADED